MPNDFVYLSDVDPSLIQSVRYITHDNFLGCPIDGYQVDKLMATRQAAERLKHVHDELKQHGYLLVVYDAYRPQCAVDHFIKWSQLPHDQSTKLDYYPTVDKKDLFELGYLGKRSSHSRGSTFDLTLINSNSTLKPLTKLQRTLENGEVIPYLDDNTVDMGSSFDLFHEVSHHDSILVNAKQNSMRELLRNTMSKHGFKEYDKEWWHYTLIDEPHPDTYFDFIVK